MITPRKIRQYMRGVWEEHVDMTCFVLNTTSLAEDAIDHYKLHGTDTQWVHDIAVELELELIEDGMVYR